VATYHNNEIKPDIYGDELARQGERFGECLLAPEKNNMGVATIGRLKQIYNLSNLYQTQREDSRVQMRVGQKAAEYGWETNALTKPKMLYAGAKAVEDGLVALNDPDLIAECRAYTRNDLMDAPIDPRLTTRHFDLLMAFCIAWQMKDSFLLSKKSDKPYVQAPVDAGEFEGGTRTMMPHFISDGFNHVVQARPSQPEYIPSEYES
jgi:hypothetical protein